MNTPHLWIPCAKIVEPKRELSLVSRVQGYFKLTARDANGRVRRESALFRNLITNQGLNYLGGTGAWQQRCAVGTGSTAPNVTDTQLVSQIAVTSTVQSTNVGVQSTEPYFGWAERTFRFAEGAAAGNLTEVAVGISSGTPLPVFARELIRDSEGEPTTFTVLEDESLDVTYIIRQYPPLVDFEDTIAIAGVGDVDIVVRASSVATTGNAGWQMPSSNGAWVSSTGPGGSHLARETQTLGAITGMPSGASQNTTGSSSASYTNDNFYRDHTLTYGLNAGNFGSGIGSVAGAFGSGSGNGTGGFFQTAFNPRIPKDATKILTLTFRHSWARKTL